MPGTESVAKFSTRLSLDSQRAKASAYLSFDGLSARLSSDGLRAISLSQHT